MENSEITPHCRFRQLPYEQDPNRRGAESDLDHNGTLAAPCLREAGRR